jgi:hypothetical protein
MKTQAIILADVDATPKNVTLGIEPGPIVTLDPAMRPVFVTGGILQLAATFPQEGHVRAPDTYGPTGGDYTGTETLPVEADVKTGVKYGEDGTEFTGTYGGGGGGAARPVGSPVVRRVGT